MKLGRPWSQLEGSQLYWKREAAKEMERDGEKEDEENSRVRKQPEPSMDRRKSSSKECDLSRENGLHPRMRGVQGGMHVKRGPDGTSEENA